MVAGGSLWVLWASTAVFGGFIGGCGWFRRWWVHIGRRGTPWWARVVGSLLNERVTTNSEAAQFTCMNFRLSQLVRFPTVHTIFSDRCRAMLWSQVL